jgi:hypothetical protein
MMPRQPYTIPHHKSPLSLVERLAVVSLLVALLANQAAARAPTTFYVSDSVGNDTAGDGSLAHPYKTINYAAGKADTAGDVVNVRGGTYRETVTPQYSGSSVAPITFQPYQGEQVTVTGLDAVSGGWTSMGNSTYSQSMSLPQQSDVFVNGTLLNVARWPNAGQNNPLRAAYGVVGYPSVNGATYTVTDSNLPSGNWTNATININRGDGVTSNWFTSRKTVTSQSGNNLTFPAAGDTDYGLFGSSNSYFLSETPTALNTGKGWCYDATAGKLYLRAPGDANPDSQTVKQTVEARCRRYGLDFNNTSYVNVTGFRVVAAGVSLSGQNNLVDQCQVLYAAPSSNLPDPCYIHDHRGEAGGFEIPGNNNTVRNSEIAYTWGSGIYVPGGSNNTIHNNVIHDVDWAGSDTAAVNLAGTANTGHDNTISNNTIYNTGRDGILLSSTRCDDTRILNNDISRFGFLQKDLGGIYSFASRSDDGTIAYNHVHDTRSAGMNCAIYLDNNSQGFTVHHNLITNVQTGLQRNTWAAYEHMYNNTIWNSSNAMIRPYPNDVYPYDYTNCNTNNNLAMTNSGSWYGNNTDNNVTVSSDPFVDSAHGDYRLRAGTAPVDAGKAIPGITPDGDPTPDAGAFQSGVTPWTAGANFKTWTYGKQCVALLSSAMYVRSDGTRYLDETLGMRVGRYGSNDSLNRRAFVKFDLSGLSGMSGPIPKAVLRLYQCDLPDNGTGASVNLYRVTSNWTDGNVSYYQSVGASISGWYDPMNVDLFTDVDITAWVQGWLNDPSSNYGLSLRSTLEGVAGSATFWDGYYGVTGPQLIITVPEPGSLSIVAIGLLGAGAYVWRRRRASLK